MKPLKKLEKWKQEPYEMQYFSECKTIWKTMVPQRGQSDYLQGELLREIEQLRYEAQENGNINWDEDFAWFCRNIRETLCKMEIFSRETKEQIFVITEYLQSCGEYANRVTNGLVSVESLEVGRIAYVEDNLYNRLSDAVGFLYACNPTPLPYRKNMSIKR